MDMDSILPVWTCNGDGVIGNVGVDGVFEVFANNCYADGGVSAVGGYPSSEVFSVFTCFGDLCCDD
jgi:hypothetical protein